MGGANPYITLYARTENSRDEIDQALLDLTIHELPSARGCTYIVPRRDFALALALSRGDGEPPELAMAKRQLGVTDEEIRKLCSRLESVMSDKPKDPATLKSELGDAVRSFGEEGKRRGMATSLPIALGLLQSRGRIRRVPVAGRLDQQRYGYVLWPEGPAPEEGPDLEEGRARLATLYWDWIGPASLANFRWFSGLGANAAKQAVSGLGLVSVPGTDLLATPEQLDQISRHIPPAEPSYALLSSLDSLFLLRRDIVSLLTEEDARRLTTNRPHGSLVDLECNALVDRGRIVGQWEFDPEESQIVYESWVPVSSFLAEAVSSLEKRIREQLGDARTFSLDSPSSRRGRIESLRVPVTSSG